MFKKLFGKLFGEPDKYIDRISVLGSHPYTDDWFKKPKELKDAEDVSEEKFNEIMGQIQLWASHQKWEKDIKRFEHVGGTSSGLGYPMIVWRITIAQAGYEDAVSYLVPVETRDL